jgi:hypothetical protein
MKRSRSVEPIFEEKPEEKKIFTKSSRAIFKAARKTRLLAHLAVPGGLSAVVTPAIATEHPFICEPRDHCETPFEAYRDIEPFLYRLSVALGKTKAQLKVYDPFYCEGSVKVHLKRLGFDSVYNENEDFYKRIEEKCVPDFDVLVTNPPFSGNNMQRILDFVRDSGKPFLLLMPQFVTRKGYYLEWLKTLQAKKIIPPLFVGPLKKAYLFAAPRGDASGAGKLVEDRAFEVPDPAKQGFQVFSGSFQCVWFMSLGEQHHDMIVNYWKKKFVHIAHCRINIDPENLPQLMAAPKVTPAERRWKKKSGNEVEKEKEDKSTLS